MRVVYRLQEFQALELSELLLGYESMVHHPGVLMPHMATAIKNDMYILQCHSLCCAIWVLAVPKFHHVTMMPGLTMGSCIAIDSLDCLG